ncbi:MAG: aconitate hydratase AcnA [Chloroflexi bacterium]|nr:aconitate hydratase AcnA [Chloroflexota bacterium]MCI0578936.1 aconitate hydratase AcnA [Chloroflexota bacterium]MCI0646873.1 aconitate hydratase AcnA [Chloroflexota bacterium]MCI0730809.1 aconitate hydratase AcnA [Chloroflexota bacterium]
MDKLFDHFGARALLPGDNRHAYYRLSKLQEDGIGHIERLPFSIKILLEAVLRNCDGYEVNPEDVVNLANWQPQDTSRDELPFKPGRVILQDFTGVPAVVDLAALRSAMARLGGDPKKINPLVPVDLVIDHSVQVDMFGSAAALFFNAEREFERNRERYEFLKWGRQAFNSFTVVPPATGIVHQVNLEYLGTVVMTKSERDGLVAFPDSLVGTDSHTTMINGLGILGWGVGGIEAEAVMLGQPIYMLSPEVVGFKLTGRLPEGATATDLVLVVTQMLRERGVVGKFVEYYGPGLSSMSLPDRATIANMCPEYGATVGYFPVDEETLNYLRRTGRSEELVALVERYTKEQDLFRTDDTPDPEFSDAMALDLGTVEPSLAGPKRPQDRVALSNMKSAFQQTLRAPLRERGFALTDKELNCVMTVPNNGHSAEISHGAVVIAAITSCTNTSNPSVMLGAGLLAKKAVEKGLQVKPYVKTSMAPGSRVVSSYLDAAGLTPYLERLGFHIVGYGCTTCIGNSGPLPEVVEKAIEDGNLVAVSVLSGNRNFEGRIHPRVKASYLASPPLVVAYALAGRADIDLVNEPLGTGQDGQPVYLRDIWPSSLEIAETVARSLTPQMFTEQYSNVYAGDELWNSIPGGASELYPWDPTSTYIQEPPFFINMPPEPAPIAEIEGAQVLVKVGDSVTTDHISPAGSIGRETPAGQYLLERGVPYNLFNSYGSRRGNDRVMTRGTFANVRLRNQMAPGTEGGWTTYLPTGQVMTIYEASLKYKLDNTPLVVLAGKEYGTGSSRDWAAKGALLLGIKLVIAESYERIHRSNLIGMGVLPLQFKPGENPDTLGLTGREVYSTVGLGDNLKPGQQITIRATREDSSEMTFQTICRIDTPVEVDYYRNGGILHTVLRQFLKS